MQKRCRETWLKGSSRPILLPYNCKAGRKIFWTGFVGVFNKTVHNCFPSSALKPVPKVQKKSACQFLDLLELVRADYRAWISCCRNVIRHEDLSVRLGALFTALSSLWADKCILNGCHKSQKGANYIFKYRINENGTTIVKTEKKRKNETFISVPHTLVSASEGLKWKRIKR